MKKVSLSVDTTVACSQQARGLVSLGLLIPLACDWIRFKITNDVIIVANQKAFH